MERVTFKATDKQVAAMCALATNASLPVGLGILHYDVNSSWSADDFLGFVKGEHQWVNLDYIEGRCVKLTLWRGKKRHEWEYAAHEPNTSWQTWIETYPTFPALMEAAGVS